MDPQGATIAVDALAAALSEGFAAIFGKVQQGSQYRFAQVITSVDHNPTVIRGARTRVALNSGEVVNAPASPNRRV